jgi:hypothetical protein
MYNYYLFELTNVAQNLKISVVVLIWIIKDELKDAKITGVIKKVRS